MLNESFAGTMKKIPGIFDLFVKIIKPVEK